MFGFFHRNATSGITIGTVTTGNTASAEITPDGKLNLVLPAMSQQAEERLTAVETQLTSVAQTAQGAADDAAALTTEIQDVRSDYAADIEAARSALQGSIDTVNATVGQHTTSISNAQRTAEAAQASASSLRGDITTLQDDVQTAQSTANTAVNQAAAASAAAETAMAGINNLPTMEVLWENPAPTDSFEKQRISISTLPDYDFAIIDFTNTSPLIIPFKTYANISSHYIVSTPGNMPHKREITLDQSGNRFTGGILFYDCENNFDLIPVYIYGVKRPVGND